MQLLLELLRKQSVSRIVSIEEWNAALLLADREEVLPLMLWRLESSAMSLPMSVAAKVKIKKREALMAGFVMRVELESLLRAFAKSAIQVMPLKGPFFAERAYGGVAHRPSKDLDLLVSMEQLGLAEAVLEKIGFARGFKHEHNIDWMRGEIKVELHFSVGNPKEFNFHLGHIWGRATHSTFGGQPAIQMSAADEILYLCLHGTRHRFTRLRYCVDIALAAQTFQESSGSAWLIHKKQKSLVTVALLGRYMADLFEGSNAGSLHSLSRTLPGTERQQVEMREFAEELWAALMGGSVTKDTGINWHRFFVRLEVSVVGKWIRRSWHLPKSMFQLVETDFIFAAKYGFHRSWQVCLFRSLRLLLK